MKRIAKFHKVSPEQFAKDWKDTFPAADDKEIQDTYEKISLPVRATAGSAGYDFFAPADIVLNPGETAKIPTGVRVEMEQDWVLKCYPRSGLGFKFRLQLNNTVGIIIRIKKSAVAKSILLSVSFFQRNYIHQVSPQIKPTFSF